MMSILTVALALAGAIIPAAQQRTPSAVIAADEAWLQAEIAGDGDVLTRLLAAEYVTVDPAGRVTGRDALVAAARRRGPSRERAAQVAAWRDSHPTKPAVRIFGDTAVLRWEVTSASSPGAVSSVDVFVYAEGQWRAIYSQHSTASS